LEREGIATNLDDGRYSIRVSKKKRIAPEGKKAGSAGSLPAILDVGYSIFKVQGKRCREPPQKPLSHL
jgi:hypothetical protein